MNQNRCRPQGRCPQQNCQQKHVHEFEGSTKLAELESDDVHNHRTAGITGEAMGPFATHVHTVRTTTDFFDHFHIIDNVTGPPINVGGGKHVHLVTGMTSCEDQHQHDFIFATLIESPLT